jgi:DNA polymerase-1
VQLENNPSKRCLLIDADIIAYYVACGVDSAVDWNQDGSGLADIARTDLVNYLTAILHHTNADTGILCMSDPRRIYFRHGLFSNYKANRTHGTPPKTLDAVKEMMRKDKLLPNVTSQSVHALEADDVIGVLATHPSHVAGEKIVASSDKDLKQIPGKHLRLKPGRHFAEIIEITRPEADYFFWTQTLTGDTTDGFPGCPGIGPVKAEKILLNALRKSSPEETELTAWEAIVSAYDRVFPGEGRERALVQARVARILRASDYDTERKLVIPWTPPIRHTQPDSTPKLLPAS